MTFICQLGSIFTCMLSLQSFDPVDDSPPDSSRHGILQARILEWVSMPFSRGSSQPRDRTQVPRLQVDSLPVEPKWKPKDTGVISLSLLQRIFPTQKSNWGLLPGRRILYQLSCQGSPSNLGACCCCC